MAKKEMIKVTQVKSTIGRKKDQAATIIGLGIRKMHQSREVEVTACTMGMIEKVKHLLKVEAVK